MSGEMECLECGMLTRLGEYHPYAACLMFRACRDSALVREHLYAAVTHAREPVSADEVCGIFEGYEEPPSLDLEGLAWLDDRIRVFRAGAKGDFEKGLLQGWESARGRLVKEGENGE